MSQLISIFCDIDDFCKWFEPLYQQRLLQDGQRQRVRQGQLSLSEVMTIIVLFHPSGYRDFKRYYTKYVAVHLRPYFPALVSYSRCVELMPHALVPLCSYLHTRQGRCTGLTFVDSPPLAVCHTKRIARPKVFEAWATRGKCSMGWYFGFKLHLMVNDQGELLAVRVTTGEVDDREPVEQRAEALWGHLYGDRGYVSKALHDTRLANGLKLITLIRRNMQPRLMRLWDRLMLRKRFLIETINDNLKNVSQIEHSRHRSLTGFMVKVGGGLIAYTYQPKKPSLGWWRGESGLPVVVSLIQNSGSERRPPASRRSFPHQPFRADSPIEMGRVDVRPDSPAMNRWAAPPNLSLTPQTDSQEPRTDVSEQAAA